MAEGNQLLHEGKWNKGMFANCKGIKGRTLGLIGFGSIAKLVCKAALALEMTVLVNTRTQQAGLEDELGFKYVSLDELLSQSDIVSIHTPSTPETKNLVNKTFLSKMKSDAVLINTARGNVVVDEDLLAKLEECKDFWVGTDVFNGEPSAKEIDWSSPLSKHPRVYGTHHCGASTQQAESAIGAEALRVIQKFASTGEIDLANTVNRAKVDKNLHKISVRHLDKVGVLVHVFTVMAAHGLNI
jgi:D-3-phosphoglycerate dehydrogenase